LASVHDARDYVKWEAGNHFQKPMKKEDSSTLARPQEQPAHNRNTELSPTPIKNF
jgi:hypothetical protein